jgi:hypothetical protein
MSALENIESKQSVVRTDFTLKYYQLEELLSEHPRLKVTGSESNVFVRSWIDYCLVRGDSIIHWREGSFEDLLVITGEFFEKSLTDANALATFIKNDEKCGAIIFVVNAEMVLAQDLQTLLGLLEQPQRSSEDDVIENGLSLAASDVADSELEEGLDVSEEKKLVVSEYHHKQLPIKVVLCNTAKESDLAQYSEILENFGTVYELGGELLEKKAKKSSAPILITLVLLAGVGAGYWFSINQEIDESTQTTPIEDSGELKNGISSEEVKIEQPAQESVSVNSTANVNVGDYQLVKEISVNQSVVSNSEDPSVKKVEKEQSPSAIKAEATKQQVIESFQKRQSVQEEIVSVQADLNNRIVSNIGIDSTQIESESKNLSSDSVKKLLEKITIVETSGAKPINIGSSINTSSTISEGLASRNRTDATSVDSKNADEKITTLVNAWMNAWQSQNFDNYSRFYSDSFRGKQSSHKKWLAWRKKRIEKPKWIKLSRSNIKRLSNDSKAYVISLTLSYASPSYKDKTIKRMTFNQSPSGYKITKEENLKVTKLK